MAFHLTYGLCCGLGYGLVQWKFLFIFFLSATYVRGSSVIDLQSVCFFAKINLLWFLFILSHFFLFYLTKFVFLLGISICLSLFFFQMDAVVVMVAVVCCNLQVENCKKQGLNVGL